MKGTVMSIVFVLALLALVLAAVGAVGKWHPYWLLAGAVVLVAVAVMIASGGVSVGAG